MKYEVFIGEKLDDFYDHIEKILDIFMVEVWDKPVGLILNNPTAVFTDEWKQLISVHWEKICLFRKELGARKPPLKYKEGHEYLIQSLDYFQQAKEAVASSYGKVMNRKNINFDFQLIGIASNLMNQGAKLLIKAIPLLID